MLIYISSKNVISLWCYMIDLQLRKTSLANKLIIYSTQRYFSIHSLNDNWVINQVCITHKFRLISSLHDSKTEEWYLELSYDDIETQWRSMFMWETSKNAITYHIQNSLSFTWFDDALHILEEREDLFHDGKVWWIERYVKLQLEKKKIACEPFYMFP